jgi:hypothetical protein
MSEKTKGSIESKKKRKSQGTGKSAVSKGGYTPFPIQLLAMEINASKSSTVLSFCAALHLNDLLHQTGLITDDAWNNVKGTVAAIRAADIISSVTSSVSTLVEAGTGAISGYQGGQADIMGAQAQQMQGQAAQTASAAKLLTSLASGAGA